MKPDTLLKSKKSSFFSWGSLRDKFHSMVGSVPLCAAVRFCRERERCWVEDGAGAVILGGVETDREDESIFFSEIHSDGRGALKGIHMKVFEMNKYPFLDYNSSDSAENGDMWPDMTDSKNLFVNAVEKMTEVGKSVLEKNNLTINPILTTPTRDNYTNHILTAASLARYMRASSLALCLSSGCPNRSRKPSYLRRRAHTSIGSQGRSRERQE